MPTKLIFLPGLERYSDIALLILRLTVGSFLIWGVWDNIVSTDRMREFEQFLANFGFMEPRLMACLSVWAQFFIGILFISGFLTRWAGIVCMINFTVAIIMVDSAGGIRASFPAMCLILMGLYLATNGAGRYSADHIILNRYSSQ